jgi:DNA-binding SARP family transcriptional activator/tetratricopeptide (TPR) repeat protein
LIDKNLGTTVAVQFSILGPVEVRATDRQLLGLAPRHRGVLAYLLLNTPTVVTVDRLIEAMWGLTPPHTARMQIQASVAAIRKVLRQAGAGEILLTKAPGYVILPDDGQFDLKQFTGLLAQSQASSDPTAAAEKVRSALALWRSESLANVTADYVAAARQRLEQRRIAAFDRLAELELSLGNHESLIDELADQVALHPTRERLTRHLMLGLYRADRQADALAAARTFRARLADEQGLDPSNSFSALEQNILTGDPSLSLSSIATTGNHIASGHHHQNGETAVPRARPPSFLPFDIPDFTGRSTELDQLVRSWSDRAGVVSISSIDGMAGIGKTALAVRAAHQLAEHFPDGQLFVDLHAHSQDYALHDANTALEMLLLQLGVSAERIPAEGADRATLWRDELTSRRVLVILDNAADAEQVRPILPGTTPSLVIITSRRRMIDLDGAQAISLDVLHADDAVALFTTIVGQQALAEPVAVMDVLQLCGFLPLAVRLAAARLRHRPQWTVAYLAERLRDKRRRLAELSTPERGIAAAFDLSYEHLEQDQQRMFRLLGLHPGRDIEPYAAAALANVPLERADALLEGLLDAHVLQQHAPGRYSLHDLVREHARVIVSAEEPPSDQRDATTRLFDHYLYTASTAVDVLGPCPKQGRPSIPKPESPSLSITEEAEATTWLEAEYANLIAIGTLSTGHDMSAHISDLAATLGRFLYDHAHFSDARLLHTHALHARQRLGDRSSEAIALIDLGAVSFRQGRFERAHDQAAQALKLCHEIGDRVGEARARNDLGLVRWRQGNLDLAYEHFAESLALARQLGHRPGEAAILTNLGIILGQQGSFEDAQEQHRRALNLAREIGDRITEANALDNLGLVFGRQMLHDQARDHHRQALELFRELDDRGGQAEALNGLGESLQSMGVPSQALDHHNSALALALDIGSIPDEARARHGSALAHRELGQLELALQHAHTAQELYTKLGAPEADELGELLASLDTN